MWQQQGRQHTKGIPWTPSEIKGNITCIIIRFSCFCWKAISHLSRLRGCVGNVLMDIVRLRLLGSMADEKLTNKQFLFLGKWFKILWTKTYHFLSYNRKATVLRSSCGRGLEPFSTEDGWRFSNKPFLYHFTAVESFLIVNSIFGILHQSWFSHVSAPLL